MARRPSKPTSPAVAPAAGPWRYAVPVAVAWLVLFAAYFLTRQLPNNPQVNRFDLLLLLPELLFANLLPGDDAFPSGWRHLPQRFDLIATAVSISAGAWGLGGLALRAIGLGGRGASAPWSDRVERTAVTFGLGLSAWSLLTLLFGLAGWLSRPLFGAVLISAFAAEVVLLVRGRGARLPKRPGPSEQPGRWFTALCLAAVAPFVLAAALAAMLPPFDFDVKEYHLGGPKEWFLDGRVHFLPHNVYTSFPFLTEMLSLSAMVVRGDWYRGALAGQLLLAGFLPLTAAAVFATGHRLFGTAAGLVGTVVYVTTPWAYRIAVIAYAEGGLTSYLALALLAVVAAVQSATVGKHFTRLTLLAGLFAGSAMACKYPGVVQVVIPIGVALLGAAWGRAASANSPQSPPAAAGGAGPSRGQHAEGAAITPLTPDPSPQGEGDRRGRVLRIGLIYSLGVLIAVGPWLVKNTVETGNPVYPLLWSVFGGRDWDAELNAKWRAGHRPPHHAPASFFRDALGVAAENDWQSLLVFSLAPLALLGPCRRSAAVVWLYVGYLYVAWWVLTHRIDRFWVPLLPAACVLAGAGAAWAEDLPRRLAGVGVGESLRG
ncbi:MAG TPA: glycosyltransferase family 39 protein, partial [Planctomycetaceae bacterium]